MKQVKFEKVGRKVFIRRYNSGNFGIIYKTKDMKSVNIILKEYFAEMVKLNEDSEE